MNVSKPVLVLDKAKILRNISRIKSKADRSGTILRPHFKTHQSKKIAGLFRNQGIKNITVSSVAMAEYFMGSWEDISIAVPFNIHQIDLANKIAQQQKLILMVDSLSTAEFLAEKISQKTGVWIEIDTGDHRTGIGPENTPLISRIISVIDQSDNLYFHGFYSHAGHSYAMNDKNEIQVLYESATGILKSLKNQFGKGRSIQINFGDTPTASLAENFDGLDSVSAGNYVFYDYSQSQIGSCSTDDIAVTLACPVISVNKERNEWVVYGGGIHLSKDKKEHFGLIVCLNEMGWTKPVNGAFLKSISQEHGVISVPEEQWGKVKIGDIVGILPVHSCMTADCMGSYSSFDNQLWDHMSEKLNG